MILKASGWLTASDFLQFVFYPSPSNQIWSLLWNTKHASNAVTLVFILLFIKWNYSIAFRIPYIYRHLAAHSPGRGSLYSCTLHCTHCTTVQNSVQQPCTLVKYSRPGTANFIQYLLSFQEWRICECWNKSLWKDQVYSLFMQLYWRFSVSKISKIRKNMDNES